MPERKWTDEDLIAAVENNVSIAGVVRALQLKHAGGTHRSVKKHIERLGLDTSHIVGQSWQRGYAALNKLPPEKVLVRNRHGGRKERTDILRRAMIESGIEHKCAACLLLPEWQGALLVLEVDHVNGDNTDNRPKNVRFLCPNCHAQTETFGRSGKYVKKDHRCSDCGKPKSQHGSRCRRCAQLALPEEKRRKAKRPNRQQLQIDVDELGYCGAGRKYGVSDNAVRKWLR